MPATDTPPDFTNDRAIFLSLGSTDCPACQSAKAPRNSFCLACYRVLPTPLQRGLYAQGPAYLPAFRAALDHLRAR